MLVNHAALWLVPVGVNASFTFELKTEPDVACWKRSQRVEVESEGALVLVGSKPCVAF